MGLTKAQLRQRAIGSTMFPPTSLHNALKRLGFVQADPIRSPARAQDLILRHRVKDYRAGDLEARYPKLKLEEDYLYAYGFMSHSLWSILHPRPKGNLSEDEQRLLDVVSAHRKIHPRELEAYFGRDREINAWGSYSKATTRALQSLHYRGFLRIAGREKGIRLYEPTVSQYAQVDSKDRLAKLVLLIAGILGPLPVRSLRSVLQHLAYASPSLPGRKSAVVELQKSGELESAVVDDIRYVWPAGRPTHKQPNEIVRFLAPFDPVVWDRHRFEHLWGWAYRFEAYTPPAKRKLGYYAMPMSWRDDMIGWVNISHMNGQMNIKPGFMNGRPTGRLFSQEFDSEVERFREFLQNRLSP
jgi:uncharacterized protein YcaQ